MVVQIVLCLLAIWGASTYRGWPVRVLWVWVTILLLFEFIAMLMIRNWYLILGVILDILVCVPLIWYPLYGYLKEWPQLREAAAGTTPSFTTVHPPGEAEAMAVGYSNETQKNRVGDEGGIELV